MNLFRRLFSRHNKWSEYAVCSIICIRFKNIHSLLETYGDKDIIAQYKQLVDKLITLNRKNESYLTYFVGDIATFIIWESDNSNRALRLSKMISELISSINSSILNYQFDFVIAIHTGSLLISNEVINTDTQITAFGEHISVCRSAVNISHAEGILVSETTLSSIGDKNLFVKKLSIELDCPSIFPNQDNLDFYSEKP